MGFQCSVNGVNTSITVVSVPQRKGLHILGPLDVQLGAEFGASKL